MKKYIPVFGPQELFDGAPDDAEMAYETANHVRGYYKKCNSLKFFSNSKWVRVLNEKAMIIHAMRRIIPELNINAFREGLTKRISSLEKHSQAAMKALSAGVSELDSLRAVMKLQSRVIAGESLDTLLAKLTDANELLALCDLAQQTNNSQLAQQATDKAVHIATGGAGKEIEHLHQAIRAIDREQTQYVERWEWMIDNLGLCVRYS